MSTPFQTSGILLAHNPQGPLTQKSPLTDTPMRMWSNGYGRSMYLPPSERAQSKTPSSSFPMAAVERTLCSFKSPMHKGVSMW